MADQPERHGAFDYGDFWDKRNVANFGAPKPAAPLSPIVFSTPTVTRTDEIRLPIPLARHRKFEVHPVVSEGYSHIISYPLYPRADLFGTIQKIIGKNSLNKFRDKKIPNDYVPDVTAVLLEGNDEAIRRMSNAFAASTQLEQLALQVVAPMKVVDLIRQADQASRDIRVTRKPSDRALFTSLWNILFAERNALFAKRKQVEILQLREANKDRDRGLEEDYYRYRDFEAMARRRAVDFLGREPTPDDLNRLVLEQLR